ncbi:MAG: hypothetical protein ACLFO2_02470 [Candidatus Woesearchaeota archaeon]
MVLTRGERKRRRRLRHTGVTASTILLIAGLVLLPLSWLPLAILWTLLLAYFTLGFSNHLSGKASFLIRTIPVMLFTLCGSLLIIAGLVTWLGRVHGPPANATSPSQALELVVAGLTLVTLLIPYFALQAALEVIEALRTRYVVGKTSVTFRRGKKRWTLNLNDYQALVISPNLILACTTPEEEADALDHVNRPGKQRLLAKKLHGAILTDTEPLVRNLKEAGHDLKAAGRAWIVTASS